MANKEICGYCSNFYCNNCTEKDGEVDFLQPRCNNFIKFSSEIYRGNVKRFKRGE